MIHLIIALLIAAAGFGSAWQIQSWRQDSKEKENAEQVLANVRLSAAAHIRRADNVIASQNEATARLGRLRDADRASSAELDRMRRAVRGRPMPASDIPTAPGAERTDTVGELLLECGAAIQSLAGKADRHASDSQTLIDAWPRE